MTAAQRGARRAVRGGESGHTENPYTIQQDLQQSMNDLVGIIRTAEELARSLEEIERSRSGLGTCSSRGTGSTTPAGTSRSTSATC